MLTQNGPLERVDSDTLRIVRTNETIRIQDYVRRMEVRSSDTFNVLTIGRWHDELEATRCGGTTFVHVVRDGSLATPRLTRKRNAGFEDKPTTSVSRTRIQGSTTCDDRVCFRG